MIGFVFLAPLCLVIFGNINYREIDKIFYDCSLDVDRPWHAKFLCMGAYYDETIVLYGDYLKSFIPQRKYSPPGFKLLKDTQDALIDLFVYDTCSVAVGVGATLCAIVETFNFSNENNMRYCSSQMAYAIDLYMVGVVHPGADLLISIYADENRTLLFVINYVSSIAFVLLIVLCACVGRDVYKAWVLRDIMRANPGINIENIIHFGNGSYNAAITEEIKVQGQWQKPACG
jgi:hypothetical protein